MFPDTIGGSWDDEGEELLACPQWLGLEDARHGQLSVPCWEEHDQGHHLLLRQKHVALRHLTDGRQGVLKIHGLAIHFSFVLR